MLTGRHNNLISRAREFFSYRLLIIVILFSLVFCSCYSSLIPYPFVRELKFGVPILETYGTSEAWHLNLGHCFYRIDTPTLKTLELWYDPLGWMNIAKKNEWGDAILIDINPSFFDFNLGYFELSRGIRPNHMTTCVNTEYKVYSPSLPTY